MWRVVLKPEQVIISVFAYEAECSYSESQNEEMIFEEYREKSEKSEKWFENQANDDIALEYVISFAHFGSVMSEPFESAENQ